MFTAKQANEIRHNIDLELRKKKEALRKKSQDNLEPMEKYFDGLIEKTISNGGYTVSIKVASYEGAKASSEGLWLQKEDLFKLLKRYKSEGWKVGVKEEEWVGYLVTFTLPYLSKGV